MVALAGIVALFVAIVLIARPNSPPSYYEPTIKEQLAAARRSVASDRREQAMREQQIPEIKQELQRCVRNASGYLGRQAAMIDKKKHSVKLIQLTTQSQESWNSWIPGLPTSVVDYRYIDNNTRVHLKAKAGHKFTNINAFLIQSPYPLWSGPRGDTAHFVGEGDYMQQCNKAATDYATSYNREMIIHR